MPILDLIAASEKDKVSSGSVLINVAPQVRSGKRNDFMVGQFTSPTGELEFKIWEEATFATVQAHGVGIYDVEVVGSEFNGVYLTVRKIEPTASTEYSIHDFLPVIPKTRVNTLWKETLSRLTDLGVSYSCWEFVQEFIQDPELNGRFTLEGAAVRHHDNKIGGLVYHTTKMLNILASLLINNPELKECADLLVISIIAHDIGKVFEYQNLSPAEYWYSNHRVRGIEYLSRYKERLIDLYDEPFYRHVQSAIAGHHGEYGDRPTTVTAAIIHYIDTLESQVSGMLQTMEQTRDDRLRYSDWGFLQPLPIGRFKPLDEDSPEALEASFQKP